MAVIYELNKLLKKYSKKYPIIIKSLDNWLNLSVLFQYPEEIRRVIYTINVVEALHRQLRKVTKAITQFPNDEALTKMLYLANKDISMEWNMTIKNWAFVISQFSIYFDDRLKPYI